MIAEIVVYCSVLSAAAATEAVSTPNRGSDVVRNRDFRGIVDAEPVGSGNGRPRFSGTTASAGRSSCCGGFSTASSVLRSDMVRNPQEIPLNVIMELSQVKNVSDLFNKFMPDVDLREAQRLVATTGFQSRSAPNVERRAALIPKPAGCSVEAKTISLRDSNDHSLYFYPPCTRVNRCGGCCAHDLLECQPTKIEMLNFEVMVSQYNGAGKLEFLGRKSLSIEQHSKCKCDCIQKAHDCTPLQTYYPNECRCMCNNEDDRSKCLEEQQLKLWSPDTCTCQCRVTQECTSGFGFDFDTCRCEALRVKTKNGYDFNRNTYSVGP